MLRWTHQRSAWGSVSCPKILRHADYSSQNFNHQPSDYWMTSSTSWRTATPTHNDLNDLKLVSEPTKSTGQRSQSCFHIDFYKLEVLLQAEKSGVTVLLVYVRTKIQNMCGDSAFRYVKVQELSLLGTHVHMCFFSSDSLECHAHRDTAGASHAGETGAWASFWQLHYFTIPTEAQQLTCARVRREKRGVALVHASCCWLVIGPSGALWVRIQQEALKHLQCVWLNINRENQSSAVYLAEAPRQD